MTEHSIATRRVEKPWGHEEIWAVTDRYVGKVLVIEAGKRLSLQKHAIKDESILVVSGRLRLYLEDDAGTVQVMSYSSWSVATSQRRKVWTSQPDCGLTRE